MQQCFFKKFLINFAVSILHLIFRMMKNKYLFATLVFCFVFTALSAQNTWTITGRIVDDNGAVESVAVALLTKDSTMVTYATTNSDGIFSLKTETSGEYIISTSHMSYYAYVGSPFQLIESKKTIINTDITLFPLEMQLSGAEIATRRQQVVQKLDRKVIDASGFISASGGSAIDILEQMPSVRVDANGELSYRGSSGFKVYVDGKPSTASGSAALEQISSGMIDNIEFITTPSAKHEADGVTGIINIVTKKQTSAGWSGIINAMGNTIEARGIDFMASYGKNNIRWQTSGEISRKYIKSDFDQLKHIDVSDTLTTTHSTGERINYTDVYFLRSGLDWYKNNTVWSFAAEGRYRNRYRGGHLHYEDKHFARITGNETTAEFDGIDYVNLHEWVVRGDVGFEHSFAAPGHKLTGSLFAFYEGDAMEYFHTDLFDMTGSRVQGHRAWEAEYRFTAQGNLDYVRPFNNDIGKFEAGYYFFSYTEDGDYTIDFFNPTVNNFERHNDLYNKYLFRRDIHALYSVLSNTHSKFSYQIGLRGEFSHRKLENNEAWAQHTWNKFDIFPSAHFSYALNKGKINFGYSRRITQPELFYMEPYVVYVDFYTAQRGNPMILPEYTNSLEAGYSRSFGDNSVSGTLFHRIRKDKIERIRLPFHTGVTIDSMANVGNDYASGAELSTDFRINNLWRMDINGSLYYYTIKNDYKTEGDDKSWNWHLAVNNNFDITKNTRVRFESYYVGPSVSTQGRVDEFFYFNLSVRQQLFNRKVSAIFNVRDIFSTAKYVNTKVGPNLDSKTIIYPKSPLLSLSLTYTFNNFKSQKKEEKYNHDMFEGTNR